MSAFDYEAARKRASQNLAEERGRLVPTPAETPETPDPPKTGRPPLGENEATEAVHFRLTASMRKQVQEEAMRRETSEAEVIREAIRQFFDDGDGNGGGGSTPPPPPPSGGGGGLGLDQSQARAATRRKLTDDDDDDRYPSR